MTAQASSDRFAGLRGRLRRAVADWRQNVALRRELADLENRRLLDPTLADIGLSRAELPKVVRGYPRRARLFERMLARVGIAWLPRGERNGLLAVCNDCKAAKRCEQWLDAGDGHDDYASFCPNARAFKRLGATRA